MDGYTPLHTAKFDFRFDCVVRSKAKCLIHKIFRFKIVMAVIKLSWQ